MKIEIDFYTDFDDFENLEKYNVFLNKYKEKVQKIFKIAIEKQKITNGNFYIGLGIVSNEKIRETNKEWRDIDKVTDVLSFPMYDFDDLEKLKNVIDEDVQQVSLGDIVICLDKVEAQAVEYGTGFEREMLYMITHGVCHLMGYDHEDLEDKRVMREAEEEILKEIEGEK